MSTCAVDTNEPPVGAVQWMGHNIPALFPQGSMQHIYVRARNTGSRTWQATGCAGDKSQLVVTVNNEKLTALDFEKDIRPGDEITFNFPYFVPLLFLKTHEAIVMDLEIVAVMGEGQERNIFEALQVRFVAGPMEQDAPAEALQIAEVACLAFYLPSGRVSRGRDGRIFPLVARSASGCRIRDVAGNEWIDYVMGWGSALLGYAHPAIRDAIRAELDSGAALPLPSYRELEVAQLLGEMMPAAETTLFGKNGSDVCTAAIRLARVYTGRSKILFTGYSGWQEPFAQSFEPALSGNGAQTAFAFAANDLEQVIRLFELHAGEVAAVMLEPAAQVEGVDGPVQDANPQFLKRLAEVCRAHGAVLIFDEIFTGFRHAAGSVQKAMGVVPDLACFGKALSGGMPLSVLVGRRDIMRRVDRIFYHPTFKGEAYSFAAAAAALTVYQSQNVPDQIDRFGRQLMNAINEQSRRLGVDGEMTGPPFRMLYRFNELDEVRRRLMRTLFVQELLKRGVLPFRGCFLPSTAHGDRELAQTVDAFEWALTHVREASVGNRFEKELEIPPVI